MTRYTVYSGTCETCGADNIVSRPNDWAVGSIHLVSCIACSSPRYVYLYQVHRYRRDAEIGRTAEQTC